METSSEETNKQRIIALSLKYNILSPHTAFVGIEKRTNASNADMVLREVPIQISADDQHLQMSPPTRLFSFGSGGGSALGGRGLGGYGLGAGGARRHKKMMMPSCSNNMTTRSMRQSSLLSNAMLQTQSHHAQFDVCTVLSSSKDNAKVSMEDLDYTCAPSSSRPKKEEKKSSEKEIWPSNDQDIVRYLINKQKFDGLWDLDSQAIMNLTGKTLVEFQSVNSQVDRHVLVSAIVISVLETRFASLSTMWYGVVQKARKRLIDLLGTELKNVDQLLENILKQF
jgi:hypothetical protein